MTNGGGDIKKGSLKYAIEIATKAGSGGGAHALSLSKNHPPSLIHVLASLAKYSLRCGITVARASPDLGVQRVHCAPSVR